MADTNLHEFENRVRGIRKSHRKRGRGHIAAILDDGQVVVYSNRRPVSPLWKSVGLITLAMLVLKASLLAYYGTESYADRVELLQSGSAIDQIGAFVMQEDPLSAWVSIQIRDLFPL
ncbi:hypothetical protein [Cochlodiniinecator piscidefendens]|uniref:hypothetical protein n=1 Tax=Cochlodiniinecator piscidefendens TaxID=2715756 RepID=UPI00140D6761|nr:hypothetical protein [Cochlodiniinecator piscidefendens]